MDDRAEAIDILTRMSTNHFYGHREQEAFKLGAEALSAERTGRWIIYPVSPLDGEDVKCSVCGAKGCAPYWDYCPHCGSQMVDVVREDEL